MGHIDKHPIAAWRQRYGLASMIETGTFRGEGAVAGLHAGFRPVYTIDVSAEAEQRARERVRRDPRLRGLYPEFLCMDSREGVAGLLGCIGPDPVLWWLDAHYPEQYEGGEEPGDLPLSDEMHAIVNGVRDHSGDVIVADDLRIYGEACAAGKLPGFLRPGAPGELLEICELLRPTHTVSFDRRDGCYLVALPKASLDAG